MPARTVDGQHPRIVGSLLVEELLEQPQLPLTPDEVRPGHRAQRREDVGEVEGSPDGGLRGQVQFQRGKPLKSTQYAAELGRGQTAQFAVPLQQAASHAVGDVVVAPRDRVGPGQLLADPVDAQLAERLVSYRQAQPPARAVARGDELAVTGGEVVQSL